MVREVIILYVRVLSCKNLDGPFLNHGKLARGI